MPRTQHSVDHPDVSAARTRHRQLPAVPLAQPHKHNWATSRAVDRILARFPSGSAFFLFDRPRRATSVTGRFLSAAALAGTVVTCPDHRAGRQPMPADPPPPRPRRARPRRRDAAATRPDWWVCESLAPPYPPRAPEWVGPVWPLCTALPPTGTQPSQRQTPPHSVQDQPHPPPPHASPPVARRRLYAARLAHGERRMRDGRAPCERPPARMPSIALRRWRRRHRRTGCRHRRRRSPPRRPTRRRGGATLPSLTPISATRR